MKNWMVFTLLALYSVWSMAGNHGGGHEKGSLIKQADLNKDGSISTDEHEVAIQKMADKRRQRFSEMDSDGDGSVTKGEAKAMRKQMYGKRKDKATKE